VIPDRLPRSDLPPAFDALLSDNFGHANCVFLREYAKEAEMAVCPLRGGDTQSCVEIAQPRAVFKLGSNPLRSRFHFEATVAEVFASQQS